MGCEEVKHNCDGFRTVDCQSDGRGRGQEKQKPNNDGWRKKYTCLFDISKITTKIMETTNSDTAWKSNLYPAQVCIAHGLRCGSG